MALSRLAPQAVACYAAVFFLVNATYVGLIHELIDRTASGEVSPGERRIMRLRSVATLLVFGAAALVALKYRFLGPALCIGCLLVYLRPEAPRLGKT